MNEFSKRKFIPNAAFGRKGSQPLFAAPITNDLCAGRSCQSLRSARRTASRIKLAHMRPEVIPITGALASSLIPSPCTSKSECRMTIRRQPAKSATYVSRMTDNRIWDRFALRQGDVIVATPPKCGTTWSQALVLSLLFGKPGMDKEMDDLSIWLDPGFRDQSADA